MSDGEREPHEEAPPGGGLRSKVGNLAAVKMRVFNGISRSVPHIPPAGSVPSSSPRSVPLIPQPSTTLSPLLSTLYSLPSAL